jgi:TolB-like protein
VSEQEKRGMLDRMAEELLPAAAQALSDFEPLIGRTVSHYVIEEAIGRGGMGVVYKARDVVLGRAVALKFLRPDLSGDGDARQRLESEARAASALDHPNIAVVYEIGTATVQSRDQLFIAMAHYTGATLRELIASGPLSIDQAVRYAIQIADGLSCAHEAGIVHRDIKPANIIVTDRGTAKIVDFGIARSKHSEHTRQGLMHGTVGYMSPEHTRGHVVDYRTDQWSLGALIYEMLTGRRPFVGDDDAVVIHAIRHDEPAPLLQRRRDVPAALADVIARCLAKNPNARFHRTAELVAALRGIAVDESREVHRPARAKFVRRAAAASALAAVAMATVVFLVVPRVADRPVTVETSSPQIAVYPFAAASADTKLASLGRELAVAFTTGLDGIGELRTVDTATTLAAVPVTQTLTLDEARKLASRLKAGRFVLGTLTAAGTDLRLDLSLYQADRAEPIARAYATAPDARVLSDAAIVGMLDELWRSEPPEVPSLAAVTKSRVPAARRAYLQGELALSRLDMVAALGSFERAIAADPTFWWAYWRSLYPRLYRDASVPPDPALLQQVLDHRWELPEPDRLLVEASTKKSRLEQLAGLRNLTELFPNYSPGWWGLANLLVHYGPYLGHTSEHARAALERFLLLNPRFVAAWDHLHWIAVMQGDSVTAVRAANEVQRLSSGVAARADWTTVLKLRAEVSKERRIPPERLDHAVEFIASGLPFIAEGLAIGFVADGSPAAQIELNEVVRRRAPSEPLNAARWRGDALAWAARGAWNSSLESAERWARASASAEGALGAYRLALAGVAWGGVPLEQSLQLRPTDERVISQWSADDRAELAWLDGLFGYLREDAQRINNARALVATAQGAHTGVLERSLAALAADVGGERQRAAREIVTLESEIADRGALLAIGGHHPLLSTAHRMLAAQWLRRLGNETEAARLLTWHEAIPGPAVLQAWNAGIGGIALIDRAELAESAGDRQRALLHFKRFVEQYDRPGLAVRPLVERATAGIARLESG